MQPNALLSRMPDTVEVGGERLAIRTGHRVWIKVQKASDDPAMGPEDLGKLLIASAYPEESLTGALGDPDGAVKAALAFFNFNEPCKPPTPEQVREAAIRSWDWDWDARYAIADFQRYYRIDLTDPATKLHWWRFWSLFTALPPDSASMGVISLRTADEDGLSAEQVKAQRERQRRVMLPARNEEEAIRNLELRWGQDV